MVQEMEPAQNRHAKEGWRLAAVSPNMAMGTGVAVTLERKTES